MSRLYLLNLVYFFEQITRCCDFETEKIVGKMCKSGYFKGFVTVNVYLLKIVFAGFCNTRYSVLCVKNVKI